MRKRAYLGFGAALLVVLASFLVWQGSFELGELSPSSPQQTVLLWVVSTLIFLLTVTLGFMLFRTAVKLYIERQRNREGSRIRFKLIAGAFALIFVPVIFLVLFDYLALNRNLRIWFTRPNEGIKLDMQTIDRGIREEFQAKVEAQARWIATLPEVQRSIDTGAPVNNYFTLLCEENDISTLTLKFEDSRTLPLCAAGQIATTPEYVTAVQLPSGGSLIQSSHMPLDMAVISSDISNKLREYNELSAHRTQIRNLYWMIMAAITLFVLFVATWIARILADQIGRPISALLRAASEVRKGNLSYRLKDGAIDELATLIRGFNEMDPGARSQQPGTRSPPSIHRGDPRKHPHRRHLARPRWTHPARESRAARHLPTEQIESATGAGSGGQERSRGGPRRRSFHPGLRDAVRRAGRPPGAGVADPGGVARRDIVPDDQQFLRLGAVGHRRRGAAHRHRRGRSGPGGGARSRCPRRHSWPTRPTSMPTWRWPGGWAGRRSGWRRICWRHARA